MLLGEEGEEENVSGDENERLEGRQVITAGVACLGLVVPVPVITAGHFIWEECWQKRSPGTLCKHNTLFLCSRTQG